MAFRKKINGKCSDRRPSSLKMCLSHLQLLLQTFYQGDGIHFVPEKTAHSFRIPPEDLGLYPIKMGVRGSEEIRKPV